MSEDIQFQIEWFAHRLSQSEINELCALTQGEQNNHAKHDQLIDRCLKELDTTKLRLILSILLRQPFEKETIRTDFIDFCLARFTDARAPYAIRALCIKLAYEQMKYWSELLNELRQMLDLISNEPLSPALRSAWIQVMKKIKA